MKKINCPICNKKDFKFVHKGNDEKILGENLK